MTSAPPTGGTKTAATQPRRSATALPPTDALQDLIDDSAIDRIGTANELIVHLQGVPGKLAALGNLDSTQATRAKVLADNWSKAVEQIINNSQTPPGDDVRNSQVDIAIHAVLALACSALETAVG